MLRPDPLTTVTLQLSDIHNFFQTQEVDPFLGENIEESGIDQLMDTLKARPGRSPSVTRIAIRLPAAAITPDLPQRTRAAIGAYCRARIRLAEQKKRDIFLQARRAVPVGFFFWAFCLVMSLLFESIFGHEEILGRIFSEGFIITGWVGLWHPAELVLFDWRPYSRDIRLYQQIAAMEVVIEPFSGDR